RVYDEPHCLTALYLVELGNVFSTARGGRPADIAEFVTFLMFPQTLEFTPYAALPDQAFFQLDLPGTGQVDVVPPGLFQVRKNADGLLQISHRPALRKLGSALVTQMRLPQPYVSSLQWPHRIRQASSRLGRNLELQVR